MDVPRLIEQADWVEGVPVCPEEDLWFSRLDQSIERGLSFAAEHGLAIPPRALERARAVAALGAPRGSVSP